MRNLILIIAMAWCIITHAQVAAYDFNKETGQPLEIIHYPDIVITNHTVANDVVLPAKIALGFPFMFNGIVYDSAGISENGYIWFGPEQPQAMSGITQPLSAQLSSKVKGIVCAMCEDLHPHINTALTTTIKSGVSGSSPMEELIIEWKNTSRADALNDAKGEDTIFFQIKLYHFMNRIEVAYGSVGLNPNISTQVEVGLRGQQASDFNNRMTDNNHNWKSSLKGTANNSTCKLEKGFQPDFGDMYVWMNLNQNPPPNGVSETVKDAARMYPVPAIDELFIETTNGNAQVIEIHDLAGRIIKTATVAGPVTRINVEELQAGVYILTLKSGAQVVSTSRVAISR